ncbi:MAG: YlbF family regulator [Clostridia bacterium]|nr:YlbF family regulator [Clostridia bacterium]
MSIHNVAAQFAEEIKNSREYQDLKQAKMKIDLNPSLRNRVEGYKRKENALFVSASSSKDVNSKTAELNKLLEELAKTPDISRFLKAEKDFNVFLQKTFKIISDALDSGLK